MNPFFAIQSGFSWATQVFVNAALFCYGHWPMEGLGNFFNQLSSWTAGAAGELYSLASWYDQTMERLSDILGWDAIRSLIISWAPDLPSISAWWGNWWGNIWGEIVIWWTGQAYEVHSWIDAARDEVLNRIQDAVSFGWFSSWWGNTSTSFASWWQSAQGEISARIETVITPVRDVVNQQENVLELLTDTGDAALKWLLDRIEAALARLW